MASTTPGTADLFYRQFLTALDGIVLIAAPSGRVVEVNPRIVELFGWAREDWVDHHVASVAAWQGPAMESAWKELLERGVVRVHRLAALARDGRQCYSEILGSVFDAAGTTFAQLNVRDVTARTRSEDALRASEERFRLFSESARDYAFILTDTERRISGWNAGAEKAFGWSYEEAAGASADMIFTPEDRAAGVPLVEVEKAATEGRAEDERWHIRRDGTRFWGSGVMRPVCDASGALQGFAKVVRDTTEQRLAQQELAASAADLARSNADLQQFAYVTSHDLQEPLRTITSFGQLLRQRYHGSLSTEADEYLDYITGAANRMSLLIRDLVAYSRVLSSEGAAFTPIRLNAAADWAIMNLAEAVRESGSTITRDDLPEVYGIEHQLVLLFQNLLSNAVKYRGNAPARVHVSAEALDGEWVISVRDEGIGIDPQHHDRIFGVFKRLHGRDVPGTGMGLAIARKIVEKHNGRLWVESEAGKGATFRFSIPQ